MAQRTQVFLVDDIDGSEAEETIRFGLDGELFEIDLNAAHAAALRTSLEPYLEVGRKMHASGRAMIHTRIAADQRTVRAWAAARGITVSARGKIPASVIDAFEAAN